MKRTIGTAMSLILSLALLAGCGAKAEPTTAAAQQTAAQTEAEKAEAETEKAEAAAEQTAAEAETFTMRPTQVFHPEYLTA